MKNIFYIVFILFLFTGCLGLMEKTGRFLDGSVFAEKTIAVYRADNIDLSVARSKDGEQFIIITFKNYPMLQIRGSMPDNEGSFHFTSLEYLAGNVHGWNEYSLQMVGTGSFCLENGVLENIEDIETIQITQGRIHRYDTRITGNDALTALRNRRERILALCEWMDGPKGQDIKTFEKHWKPLFFPEITAKSRKPDSWRLDGDSFQRAEDINWNTGYTERIFPEELWPVRNSGTLLRDWEEALYWIYFKYEWDNIIDLFSGQIVFNKIK
ncbi:MAG: hypothetical protein FWD26_06825 [Treponema sp.]|nr:hypothetical protein [Treponema sp.]